MRGHGILPGTPVPLTEHVDEQSASRHGIGPTRGCTGCEHGTPHTRTQTSEMSHVSVVKLNKSGGVVQRERDERKAARERRIREYFFGQPGNPLQPATTTVRSDTLKVFRIGRCGHW